MKTNNKHFGFDCDTNLWGFGIGYIRPYDDIDYQEIEIVILCFTISIRF